MKEKLTKLKIYFQGSISKFALALLFALVSVCCKLAIPFVCGLAIDSIREGNYDISVHLILMIAFMLAGSLFRYLFEAITAYVGQKVVKKMRDELFKALNDVPVSYIDTHYHGDLLLRLINDIENVQTGLITGAGTLFEGAMQIIITIVFMAMLNWILAIVVIVLTPISIIVSRIISSKNSKYFKAQNAAMGHLTAYSLESLTAIEAIKAYGLEDMKEEEFDLMNKKLDDSSFKAVFAASWINPSTRLVNNIIYAAVTMFGALLLIQANPNLGISLGVGSLSSFLSYSYQYMTPFNEISNVASELSYAFASFSRIQESIDSPKDVDNGKLELGDSIDTLEAKNVDFSYDGKRTIIKNFNLDIYKGHKIAFVGPTGCGKTTIINILMRFYDPQSGGFFMNDISTADISKKEMRSHIGMVLQETWLKKASIRDNIAFARPDASFEEIVEAAKKAHADSFIRRFPDGYDTIVSNSSGLSMGEKQLLCVARIMLASPEIILLDEATSNIDLRTEIKLSEAFDELMRGKTSLVVAHRLSTIKNSDLIVVLKDGEIIETGNFSELMEKNGFFAELYNSQLA